MNILVTGGMGFIGSHTCTELLGEGYNVIIADNLSNSNESVLEKIFEITGRKPTFYKGDVENKAFLSEIFQKENIDGVIHFAGFKAVGESVKEPLKYYRNNIDTTLSLLEIMEEYNVKKLVFSSSATVYGTNNPAPYKEDMPKSAVNPYGATKVMIEQILEDLFNADNSWSIALLRYFNPIGAHKSGLLGENPNGIPNNLFPFISKVAVGKLPQLSVFGNDYPTPDGTGVRDYIHVVDLAKGHLAALSYLISGNGCEAFNLGTGRGTGVLELLKEFEKAADKKIPYVIAPRREGDGAIVYADTQKAKDILKWEAKLTIGDMCRDGWNFAKTNLL